MNLGAAKDLVREHFGRIGIPSAMLGEALAGGRRMVEQHANFWWMRDELEWALVVDQPVYSITTDGGDDTGLEIPGFKDPIALRYKEPTRTRWEPVELGETTKEDLDLIYATDDEGTPECAAVLNTDLFIYPPMPQVEYDMKLYYFQWTNNPLGNLETDDLLSFFPDALIWGAIAWGYQNILKDMQGAEYWRFLLGGKPYGRGGQLALLKKENFKRLWQDMVSMEPRVGPGKRSRRRLDSVRIYR